MLAVIRGAGDIATGIALRLWRSGIDVAMCDLAVPTSIRRTVCLSEALRLGSYEVEGIRAQKAESVQQARTLLAEGTIPVLADPEARCAEELCPRCPGRCNPREAQSRNEAGDGKDRCRLRTGL